MSFQTPKEVFLSVVNSGKLKVQTNTSKLLLQSFFAGAYIAFGGFLALKIGGGIPEIKSSNPGLASLIFGGVFPVGLVLVIMTGAELFTGNTFLLIPALRHKEIKLIDIAKNWSFSFLGNFIGSLFVAYFFVHITQLLGKSPWHDTVTSLAVAKVNQPFVVLFWKAVACNWLVCLAIWLSIASKQLSGKILGIWLPIMAFVALGFEHSVANMFFIPLGIFEGAEVSWVDFLIDNLLPVTLGNILGGAAFVGLAYSYIFKEK
ncbi:formate/nitrite transporter family protein [Cyclobacteriaceae bacterium]|nr:formate/nitrite transporter family protein [Cyclobacteriaceae bacterium]